MRSSIISVLASISALALAQSLDGLPKCAQTAALSGAAGSGCDLTDSGCLCNDSGFIASLKAAIGTTCSSAADQQAACTWGNTACSAYGVSIPCSSSTSSAPADSGNSMSTSSSSAPPESMPASGVGSYPSTMSSVAAGSNPSLMMSAGSSMTGSMTTSTMSMSSMASASSSMTGVMNGTNTNGNLTHSATNKPSATAAGPTSRYSGAGNAAVRHSGVVGTVLGVAMLFAFF